MVNAQLVTEVALLLGVLSFLLFFGQVLYGLFSKRITDRDALLNKAAAKIDDTSGGAAPSVSDVTQLIQAISGLTDSLAKAGPSLTSLIAAVLFVAIAAVSSGALRGSDSSDAAPAQTNATTGTHDTSK